MNRSFFLTALITLLLAVTTASAQIPRTFSFQGFLADAAGNAVPDGGHTVLVRLYDVGGALLYSETHSAPSTRGIIDIVVGSVTPIPPSIDFSSTYFIGLTIDGGTELSPRTALTSVPYALRAGTADNVVTSVNTATGAITLEGGGGTTVNRNGNTFTISSSGGSGSGIAGVQSPDGSLSIINANGPIAGISIADGGVTLPKINSASAVSGNALMYDGSAVTWGTPTATLALPYSGSSTSGSDLFAIAGSGNGSIGVFRSTSGSAARSALVGIASAQGGSDPVAGVEGISSVGIGVIGRGSPASVSIFGVIDTAAASAPGIFRGSAVCGYSDAGPGVGGISSLSSAAGVLGFSTGSGAGVEGGSNSGTAGRFRIISSANSSNALVAETSGSGVAVAASNSSPTAVTTGVRGDVSSTAAAVTIDAGVSGVLGRVTGASPGAGSAGVRGVISSTGSAGHGVLGYHAGSGSAVYGQTPGGYAVHGRATGTAGSPVGVRGEVSAPSGIAVEARYAGTGIGTALELDNGALRVAGTNKAAFVHTATVANKVSSNGTDIDNAMCNGDPDALLFVTQLLTTGPYNNSPIGVYYNSARGKWEIFNEARVAIPTGAQFNVLVIKQ